MIFQWGSALKVSIELPATSRHGHNMTERLLKATLSPNQTNKQRNCTVFQSFIIILPSSRYGLNNVGRDVKTPNYHHPLHNYTCHSGDSSRVSHRQFSSPSFVFVFFLFFFCLQGSMLTLVIQNNLNKPVLKATCIMQSPAFKGHYFRSH